MEASTIELIVGVLAGEQKVKVGLGGPHPERMGSTADGSCGSSSSSGAAEGAAEGAALRATSGSVPASPHTFVDEEGEAEGAPELVGLRTSTVAG
jgi:hypothetical protein